MKAVVFDRYGDLESLRIADVPKPEPDHDEVRLKVYSASINPADAYIVQGRPFPVRLSTGLFKPKISIPGTDVAGMVDAMGPEAMECEWGQEVYADLSGSGFGAFAEYVCVPKSSIALKPSNLDYDQAASVPVAAATALQGLMKGEVLSYRSALIIGASGGVGHFALQLAKNYGLHVTAVCSTAKMDFVKSLGADKVIDYKKEDYTKTEGKYELIFDTAGKKSVGVFKKMLTRDGRFVACAFNPSALLSTPFGGILSNKKVVSYVAEPNMDDLATLRKLIESGKITPHVDKVFDLDRIVEAFNYWKLGQAKGKIAIHVSD